MDLTARAALIRERFKKRYPSKALPLPKPKDKPQAERNPSFGGIAAGWFGNANAWNWGKTDWVQSPQETPRVPAVQIKRNRGKSALGKIADKWRPDFTPEPNSQ